MKDKAFLTLSGLFFIIFFIAIGVVTLDQPVSKILKAQNVNPSPLKSFAVAFPQVGTIGNEQNEKKPTEIKVTVTMRDVNGTILPNRRIKLNSSLALVSISPTDTQVTDNNGQAVFFVSSEEIGEAKLSVTDIESDVEILNIPSIEFTN